MTPIPDAPKPKPLTAMELFRMPVPGLGGWFAGKENFEAIQKHKKTVLNIRIDNATEGLDIEASTQQRYMMVGAGVVVLVIVGAILLG